MVRCIIVLLVACFLFMSTGAARADVVGWDPTGNNFFKRHISECVYLGRSFQVNGTEGSVSVRSEPSAKNVVSTIENDEIIYLEYSCLYKGKYWGFLPPYHEAWWFPLSGWVEIDQLLVLYDSVSFQEDCLSEFYAYTGDFYEIKKARAVVAWSYPGSGVALWTVANIDTANFRVLYAYPDAQGREWGFVTHFYGSSDIWVCLSEPLNRDIPVFNPPAPPAQWVSDTVHIDIGKLGNPPFALIVGLVALLPIGTMILIKVFWRPGESMPERRGHD